MGVPVVEGAVGDDDVGDLVVVGLVVLGLIGLVRGHR